MSILDPDLMAIVAGVAAVLADVVVPSIAAAGRRLAELMAEELWRVYAPALRRFLRR